MAFCWLHVAVTAILTSLHCVQAGICHQCRQKLLKNNALEIGKRKLSCVNDDDVVEEAECTETLKVPRKSATKVKSYALDPLSEYTQNNCTETCEWNFSQETSELSQSSEASATDTTKLEVLNKFLSLSGVSPFKQRKVFLKDSSRRTQQRYINKTKQCIELMMSTVCPGEEAFLKTAINNENTCKEDSAVLETLIEIYNNGNSWTFQRQILSMIVKDKDFPDAKRILPDLTRWKYKYAKQHIDQHGVGVPVPDNKTTREKYSSFQIDHFVDFITSGQVIKDQPFGEKTLKMETGEVIKIPTVIRSLIPSSIISQYMDLCREENVKPLGESTLFKILDECSAVVRKCIEGLDNFVMEGCKGFEELEKVLLDMPSEDSKVLKANLQKAKTYLKTGYKMHVSKESFVEDHCISYALSSLEPHFMHKCDHEHSMMCTDCENLENCLNEVWKRAQNHNWNNEEATMYMVEEAIQAIQRWKSHLVRSRNQEQAKSDLLKDMTENDAVITSDWAMKFLPRKYREGQVDWFAKRGINWHIAVVLLKTGSRFSSLTYVHIFETPISQDASVTSQILIDVAMDLLRTKPNLKFNFISDNAGCYKSSMNLLMLHHKLNEKVAGYHFSEAQNGKGPCDRRAAHIKAMIRRYINQGNDVTSASQMKEAAQKEGKCKSDIKIKVVNAVNVLDGKQGKSTIPLISKMYDFVYGTEGLRMWKAYNIGEGNLISWDSLPCPQEVIELQTVMDWDQGEERVVEQESGTASFYGNSHISVPFQDASPTTNLELRFKTTRPHGLLFLAAGDTDFLKVELNGGIIETRLDLGSGEVVLNSPQNLRLDDQTWHVLKITRNKAKIDLFVDGQKLGSESASGSFYELNIQNGIFLGGMAHGDANAVGEVKHFRGCLGNVVYNQYDILDVARRLNDPKSIHKISWDCNDQFNVESSEPISFLLETSFIALPHLRITTQGTLSFNVKTKSFTALLMFCTGNEDTAHSDLFAIEIIRGKIKVTVKRGSSDFSLDLNRRVNDGSWHEIEVSFYEARLVLRVDEERSQGAFDMSGKTYFSLGGHLFVGGVGHHARVTAIAKGLTSLHGTLATKGSLQGCIKNININSQSFGFHEIQISSDINPSCAWSYPCAANPCKINAQCIEKGDNFECICDSGNCVRVVEEAPDGNQGENDDEDIQLVVVNKLMVEEGAKKVISTNSIEVLFDLRRYRVRESAVQFHVIEAPQHGRIEVAVGRNRNHDVFTLLDLIGNKVSYIHDGSETYTDDVTMEINIAVSNDGTIPERLTQRYGFVLPIIVIPKNDAPVIYLEEGLIQMVRNTKLRITNSIINTKDPDNGPSELIYTSTCPENKGYFERSNDVGQSINTFTQMDVNQNQIWYVHRDGTNSECRIQVRDREIAFGPIDFRIRAIQLRLQPAKNTGIELFVGTSVVIQKENLTVVSNVPSQELEIRYNITRPPRYGEVQRHNSDKSWVSVNTFTQRHINRGQVRYIHKNLSSPSLDEFMFIVSSRDQRIPQQVFSVRLKSVMIEVFAPRSIRIEVSDFKRISSNDLRARTNNHGILSSDIVFTIIRPPFHGVIFKLYRGKSLTDAFREMDVLGKDSTFTQADIDNGFLVYKIKQQTYEKMDDSVDLKVSALGAQPKMIRLRFQYIPEQTDVRFVNNGLDNVYEGGQKVIERRNLYLEMTEYGDFEFSVIDLPEHGQLQLVDPRSMAVMQSNISRFSNGDIRDSRLVYKHDNSESDKDSFMFVASPVIQTRKQLQVNIPEITGTLEIRMLMRNDNPPVRTVDKVFNVVTNGECVITLDDLAFSDPDIDYDTMNLLYKRRGISNGKIIFTENKTEAFDFTQSDIANGHITYQHSGTSLHGRVVIWVSDGHFYTTSLFEIQASAPYIRLVNNTGIIAQIGENTPISLFNLSIETNINIKSEQIRFVLIEEPLRGHLKVRGQRVTEFRYSALKEKLLTYDHNGKSGSDDMFRFAVIAENSQVQGQFPIKVIISSQNRPPRVVKNNILEVSESGTAVLTESHLLVTHPDSLPSGIIYTVRMAPKHGQLYIAGHRNENQNFLTFSQQDINQGRVEYHHSDFNPSDMFFFDVSNGMQYLKGLEFVIEIIPSNLQLQTQNLSVREGSRKSLTPSHLHLNGRYLDGKTVSYYIIKQPSSGRIENVRHIGVALTSFTTEELQQGSIRYVHDDSETDSDEFSVKARVDRMESPVKRIHITVQTINDQPPRVVVNRGITLWRGSLKRITSDILKAEDPDSTVDSIMYSVTSPTNGHIALLNNTFREIVRFNQDLVNKGLIVFVHQGADSGQFQFHTSDGVNSDVRHIFKVTAKPLILSLVNNQPMKIYPGKSQPITTLNLLAKTNDLNHTRTIIYNVESKPKKGKIVTMFQGQTREIQSFKQEEINKGQIFYTHISYPETWGETDSVRFDVTTLYAEPVKGVFEIDVSYGNRNSLVDAEELTVDEGAEGVITRRNLDVTGYKRELESSGKQALVTYMIDSLPQYGTLSLRGQALENGDKFTQESINLGHLKYSHDDSDTISDSFTFSLHVKVVEQTNKNLESENVEYTSSFNITINPINDERFTLITTNPTMDVVQGLSAEVTSDVLKTVDKDTPPDHIRYEITIQPTNGILGFTDNPKIPIQLFTQKDIDERRVIFLSDGWEKSGSFQFRVSDGAFEHVYKFFKINIVQITLDMVRNNNIKLLQGDSSVYIGRDILDTRTNAIRSNITFNVTQVPRYGNLYIDRNVIVQFKQTHLDNSQLLYIQNDMSSDMDFFICSVYHVGSNEILRNKKVNVIVLPLIQQNPVDASQSATVAMTMRFLDASKLANLTRDDPKYTILQKPKFGKLMWKIRRKRAATRNRDLEETDKFTHEDVRLSRIFYVKNDDSVDRKGVDSFAYVLSARGVQPARGMLQIKLSPDAVITTPRSRSRLTPLYPPEDDGQNGVEKGGKGKFETDEAADPKNPNQSEVVSPNVRNDFIIILAILIPLFILVIIVLIVVYFLWKRQRYREYSPPDGNKPRIRPEISGPVPLDQPHVHIEPQDDKLSDDEHQLEYAHHNYYNVPMRNVSKGEYENDLELSPLEGKECECSGGAEISYAVPECKVTPLADNEGGENHSPTVSSDRDSVNLFDWTLMDPELLEHCRTTAPVLRENQYWV